MARRIVPIVLFAWVGGTAVVVEAQPGGAFPPQLCSSLPELTASRRDIIDRSAPKLKGSPARDMPSEFALQLFKRAHDKGLSIVDVFTEDAVREDCAVLIDERVVRDIDSHFDLDLLMPLSGRDVNGEAIKVQAILLGRGYLYVVYEHFGDFTYYHPAFDQKFSYRAVITMTSPVSRKMQIDGVHGPHGLAIKEVRKISDDEIEVTAGIFHRRRPSVPIHERGAAPTVARQDSAPFGPRAPVGGAMLLSPVFRQLSRPTF